VEHALLSKAKMDEGLQFSDLPLPEQLRQDVYSVRHEVLVYRATFYGPYRRKGTISLRYDFCIGPKKPTMAIFETFTIPFKKLCWWAERSSVIRFNDEQAK
jgi:hypothetical protein